MSSSFPAEEVVEKKQRKILFRRLFRRIFLEDWGTKLIALAITAALWLGVTGLRAPTTVRLKGITLVTRVSNDMEITNTPLQEVDIVVTGDKRKIDQLNTRDLVISVDLTDVNKSGDRIIQLAPETVNFDLPSGIKLEEIQPGKVAMSIERVAEREVEVKPDIDGNVPEGFEIYGQIINPAKVRIRGAESFVRSIDSVMTEKISVDGKSSDFVANQVGLTLVNTKVSLLDTIVSISFRIGEKRVERMITVPYKTETESKTVRVLLKGPRGTLDKLQPEQITVEQLRSEDGTIKLRAVLPAEITSTVEVIDPKP